MKNLKNSEITNNSHKNYSRVSVIVLGASGSLGKNTLELLKKYSEDFSVSALVGHKNQKTLQELKEKFAPKAEIYLTKKPEEKKVLLKILKNKKSGKKIIINLISGIAGTEYTKIVLESGHKLLTANKEGLLANFNLIKKYKNQIIPLDSEHNAIYEILKKHPGRKIKKIYLPCSGGKFWEIRNEKKLLNSKKPQETTKHPRWKMGPKISVESACLINKGLEIIEASLLFNLTISKIGVLILPQCQLHGAVEFFKENSSNQNQNKSIAPKNQREIYGYFGPPLMKEHIENGILDASTCFKGSSLDDNGFLNKNHPIEKFSRIKKVSPTFLNNSKLNKTGKLNGIKIVKNFFKENPPATKISKFLEFEENLINKYLKEEIEFLDILDQLKKF